MSDMAKKKKSPGTPNEKAEKEVETSSKPDSANIQLKVRFGFDTQEVFFAVKDLAAEEIRSLNDQAIVLLREALTSRGLYPRVAKRE